MTPITNADTVQPVTIDPGLKRKLAAAAKKARDGKAERDRLLREAHLQGAGARELARLVGLTHPGVLRIVSIIKEPHHGSDDQQPPWKTEVDLTPEEIAALEELNREE